MDTRNDNISVLDINLDDINFNDLDISPKSSPKSSLENKIKNKKEDMLRDKYKNLELESNDTIEKLKISRRKMSEELENNAEFREAYIKKKDEELMNKYEPIENALYNPDDEGSFIGQNPYNLSKNLSETQNKEEDRKKNKSIIYIGNVEKLTINISA